MSESKFNFFKCLGAICIMGMPIMLADPPEIITSNIGKWLEFFGVQTKNLPLFIHSQTFHFIILGLWILACFYALAPQSWSRRARKNEKWVPMPVAIQYLIEQSLWSEKQYRKLNFRSFITQDYALEELLEKAKSGAIVIKGAPLNKTQITDIPKEYWQYANIEYDINNSNTCCIDINRMLCFDTYTDLTISSYNYETIWPDCGMIDKLRTAIYMYLKVKIYYRIKASLTKFKTH